MRRFGELEAVIMDRLWELGRPALVREMVDDLHEDRPLAYTTVMTVMDNLYRKGWLRRERDAWRYEPTGSRSGYTAALMNDALATSSDRRTALTHFALQISPRVTLRYCARRSTRRAASLRQGRPGDHCRGAGCVRGPHRHPRLRAAGPGQLDGPGAAAGHCQLPGRRMVGRCRPRPGRPDAGGTCPRRQRGAEPPHRSLRAAAPCHLRNAGRCRRGRARPHPGRRCRARTTLTALAHLRAAGRQALQHAETARLVGHAEPALGAVLVEHSEPTAYCVAGRYPTVILTTGAVQVLDPAQLDAALAHERAHLTSHHHWLVAMARIGRQVLPFLPLMRGRRDAGSATG
jgi:predicted transcriptional regulator